RCQNARRRFSPRSPLGLATTRLPGCYLSAKRPSAPTKAISWKSLSSRLSPICCATQTSTRASNPPSTTINYRSQKPPVPLRQNSEFSDTQALARYRQFQHRGDWLQLTQAPEASRTASRDKSPGVALAQAAIHCIQNYWKPAVPDRDTAPSTAESKPIKVLIADVHSLVRNGLAQLINHSEDCSVCCEAANGEETLIALAEKSC